MTEREKQRKEVSEMLKRGKTKQEVSEAMNAYFKKYCVPGSFQDPSVPIEGTFDKKTPDPYSVLTEPLLSGI